MVTKLDFRFQIVLFVSVLEQKVYFTYQYQGKFRVRLEIQYHAIPNDGPVAFQLLLVKSNLGKLGGHQLLCF